MSLQKVISTYFTDLLDYLASKNRKYNGDLNNFFDKLKYQDKKELLNKLSSVYTRIDILGYAQERYWKSKNNLYVAYMIILVMLIIMTLVVMIFLFIWNRKYALPARPIEMIKDVLTYVIMYVILLGIYVVLLRNVSLLMGKAKSSQAENAGQLSAFKNMLNFDDVYALDFTTIGYKLSENRVKVESLLENNDHLQPHMKGYSNLTEATKKGEKNKAVTDVSYFDYESYFSANKDKLKESLTNFYAKGDGYLEVKKKLISSSNILILQELNLIMRYYYKLLQKKQNVDSMLDNTQITETLDNFVVKDMSLVFRLQNATERNPDLAYVDPTGHDEATELVKTNLSEPDFLKQFDYLKRCYTFLAFYLYQIYIKKATSEAGFDASIKLLMPHEIDISILKNDANFYTYIRNGFKAHAQGKLASSIKDAKTASDLGLVYTFVLNELQPILYNTYQITMLYIQGNYDFPFNPKYMDSLLREEFANYVIPIKNPSFIEFKNNIYGKVICPLLFAQMTSCYELYRRSLTDSAAMKKELIARIAANISKFNIKVADNSKYVIGKLEEINKVKSTSEMQSSMMEVIQAIDRDVAQKKLGGMNGVTTDDYKYLDADQFVAEVDKITYTDLKVGLNYQYANDILNTFYMTVSGQVVEAKGTSKDIYFNDRKKLILSKLSLFFIGAIALLSLVYHGIVSADEWSLFNRAKEEEFSKNNTEKEIVKLKNIFLDGQVNMGIRMVLPIAGGIFVLCLLVSLYLKAEAKVRFNQTVIDTNTSELRNAFNDLYVLFDEIDEKITTKDAPIANISTFDIDDKVKLYKTIKVLVDKYEKCNYVLNASKVEFPFPYGEIIVDAMMIVVILGSLIYLYGKIEPIRRIKEIKKLNSMKEQGQYADSDPAFISDVTSLAGCHDSEIDNIMFTLKVLFFMSIIMFLIFYSSKVISSATDFEAGVYNSVYFEESSCLE